MARPAKGYRNAKGERIPGTTTIIGRFKESGGLIHWAWKIGMEGKDYRELRDQAAGIGNIAHDMVEHYIHNQKFDESPYQEDMLKKARMSFDAFRSWSDSCNLEVVETETPLVSEKHQYGGTPDAMFIS